MPKSHELIGWDVAWSEFCKTLKELHQSHQEWLALTRYLVGVVATNHPNKAKTPSVACTPPNGLFEASPGGVMFVPIFDRSYCLDTCYRLAKEFKKLCPEEPTHFLIPEGNVPKMIADDLEIIWHPKSILRVFKLAPSQWLRGGRSWLKATSALRKNPKTRQALGSHFVRWLLHLARSTMVYYCEIAAAKQFLKDNQIKAVVTINDIVKPAAPLIAAANQLGLITIVIQHGAPGPQSAPFMAQRGWIWGKTSKNLFCKLGVPERSLDIIGNFEIDECDYEAKENSEQTTNRLLLLSQWRASTGWSEPEFQDFFSTVAEAAKKANEPWELMIRLHPNEDEQVKKLIAEKINASGVAYTFTSPENTIEEDIVQASFACSVCSSSIMHAIAANKPCALLISERLESRVGTPLLHRHQVARNGNDFVNLLNERSTIESEDRDLILANFGCAMKTAASKLADYVCD